MKLTTSLAIAATLVRSAVAAPGDCRPLRGGSAPVPLPNNPEAFGNYSYYDDVANAVAVPVNHEAFLKAGHATILGEDSYATYRQLDSYDVNACAKACDESKDCASCKSLIFVFDSSLCS